MAEQQVFYDIDDTTHFQQKPQLTGKEKIQVSATQYVTTEQIAGLAKVEENTHIGETILQISTKKVSTESHVLPYNFYTIIEGVSDEELQEMSNPDKYRICLLRFRRRRGEGPKWRIPMLPYETAKRTSKEPPTSGISETNTWWPIKGRITKWFRGSTYLSDAMKMSITESSDDNGRRRFCSTRNIKARVGVAIFKYTGKGGEGWTRISNISHITLYLTKLNKITVKMDE